MRQTESDNHLNTDATDNGRTSTSRLVTLLRDQWRKISIAVILVLLPLITYSVFSWVSAYPARLRFGRGQESGRYSSITVKLENAIEKSLRNERTTVEPGVYTRGSLDNLRGIQFGEHDFALFQAGTFDALGEIEFKRLDTKLLALDSNETGDEILSFDEFKGRWPKGSEQDKYAQRAQQFLNMPRQSAISRDVFLDTSKIRHVANLYYEALHFIVPRGSNIKSPSDLVGKRLAVGPEYSGHYAMSLILLRHYGLADLSGIDSSIQTYLIESSDEFVRRFENNEVDAAFVTIGVGAQQLIDFFQTGQYEILPIRMQNSNDELVDVVPAFDQYDPHLSSMVIPAGTYGLNPFAQPGQDIHTVAVRAQLLTHSSVDWRVVREVTRIMMSQQFLTEAGMTDLLSLDRAGRRTFAQEKPSFPIHDGAISYYQPEDFDASAFEGWEALYSLGASFVIATFLLGRWIVHRRERKSEHKLDHLIRALLAIEQKQVSLDCGPESKDEGKLQELLDEITSLRRDALEEFSAHDLKDDPSFQCLLELCHYVSDKVNAKISRQRIDLRFSELVNALDKDHVSNDQTRGV